MKNAKELLDRFNAGICTNEERLLVEKWMLHKNAGEESGLTDADFVESRRDIWRMVAQNRQPVKNTNIFKTAIFRAAIIMIIISAGLWSYREVRPASKVRTIKNSQDLSPGGDKAILTLGNGTKISLEEAVNGEIANQAGIQIIKNKAGQIIYKVLNDSPPPATGKISFNMIETPRGGQYQVILPDQSRVWLNAESSLRYPTTFTEERKVLLKGEGYFEVAHDKTRPFTVVSDGQVVKVLGTHFNINSYSDEPLLKTTLIRGSVNVYSLASEKSELLAPGEQTSLTQTGRLSKLSGVNIPEAVAWKDQLFYFNNSSIESVMRQVSRWYDVAVEYEGKIPTIRLSGEMHRRTHAAKVLEILSYFKVKYRIENQGTTGQKIIISQ